MPERRWEQIGCQPLFILIALFCQIDYEGELNAPIAQLDRALPSEGRGQRFESSWVRQRIFQVSFPKFMVACFK